MYLVDTNILMDYPNFIKENLNNIVISEGVIGELDKLKDSIDKNKSIKARKANRELKKYWNEIKFLLEEKQYHCTKNDLLWDCDYCIEPISYNVGDMSIHAFYKIKKLEVF